MNVRLTDLKGRVIMDSITQIAFGAVVGQAGWRKKFGRRAILAGASAGLLPDLDVMIRLNDVFAGWLYHRGISHSLIGAPFLGIALGFGFWFYYRWRLSKTGNPIYMPLAARENLSSWLWLGVIGVTSHIWLDLLTPYGTQLLAPLTNYRFALNAMPIIDFVYSLIIMTALAFGLSKKIKARTAQSIAGVALFCSLIWQTYAWQINMEAQNKARAHFEAFGKHIEVISYPTLFTPFIRRINAQDENNIYIAFWTKGDDDISWYDFPKQTHPLIQKVKLTRGFQILNWFAHGEIFWRIHHSADGHIRVEAHDLRYLSRPYDGSLSPQLRGLWGIFQDFDQNGHALDETARFTMRPPLSQMTYFLKPFVTWVERLSD